MRSHSTIRTAALAAVLAIALHAAPGEAATRYIGVSGMSSGPGTSDITIESFDIKGPGGESPLPRTLNFFSSIPIPGGSSPPNTAAILVDSLNAMLPGDYTVGTVSGHPHIVEINRNTGFFSLMISENVPGQTIEEIFTVPVLGGPPLVWLGVLLSVAAVIAMVRRRRWRHSST